MHLMLIRREEKERRFMVCPNCGAPLPDTATMCYVCKNTFWGAGGGYQAPPVMPQMSAYNTPYPPYPNSYLMPKNVFFKSPGVERLYKRIKDAGISAYILGGLSLAGVLMSSRYLFMGIPLLFTLFVIGMGLGIHLACNQTCAILLLIFSAIYLFLCLVTIHFPGGLLLLVDGIYSTIATSDIQNAYKEYVRSNGTKVDFN